MESHDLASIAVAFATAAGLLLTIYLATVAMLFQMVVSASAALPSAIAPVTDSLRSATSLSDENSRDLFGNTSEQGAMNASVWGQLFRHLVQADFSPAKYEADSFEAATVRLHQAYVDQLQGLIDRYGPTKLGIEVLELQTAYAAPMSLMGHQLRNYGHIHRCWRRLKKDTKVIAGSLIYLASATTIAVFASAEGSGIFEFGLGENSLLRVNLVVAFLLGSCAILGAIRFWQLLRFILNSA